MLAPDRFLELIRDRRDTAAAVAKATTALTSGLSATNQKPVLILFISSIRRPAFQKGLRIFPARDLAKTGSRARSCSHETLELAETESSVYCTLDSHGDRSDRSRDRRAAGANARGLLGSNCHSGRHAIQSRRYACALHRTHSRDGPGRGGRSGRNALLWSESDRIPCRDPSHRLALLWLSAGENRLSICQCHPDDHCLDSTLKSRTDRRPASIH